MTKAPTINQGVYTIDEAATLLRMDPTLLRRWFAGGGRHKPVLRGDYDRIGARLPLSFLDLVDALVLKRLRARDFSMQYLRKVYTEFCNRINSNQGFATHKLVTDGYEVFDRVLELDTDKARFYELIRRRRNAIRQPQQVSPELLSPELEDLTFDINGSAQLALKWHPASGILIDPKVNFGTPTVEATGIAAHVLAEAWQANDEDARAVADWYEIDLASVKTAAAFIYGKAA